MGALLNVAFFSKCCVFLNLPKNDSKSLFWTWNLNFPPITVNKKFKFQAQDSFLEYFYFGDLKNESNFLKKKPPLDVVLLKVQQVLILTTAPSLRCKKNIQYLTYQHRVLGKSHLYAFLKVWLSGNLKVWWKVPNQLHIFWNE